MACCPYAMCTFAGPVVLAAPSLFSKFMSATPSQKAAALVLLPMLVLAAASMCVGGARRGTLFF